MAKYKLPLRKLSECIEKKVDIILVEFKSGIKIEVELTKGSVWAEHKNPECGWKWGCQNTQK